MTGTAKLVRRYYDAFFGEIDLQQVEKVRSEGAVFNHAHWCEQPGAGALPKPDVISLD